MAAKRVVAGRYRLEERLGGGGMSVVWRAHDEVLGRQVAVKMVSARHVDEALARERVRTEAAAAARLHHPHLTRLLDHSASAATPYLVMELLEGQTLARRMGAGPLPARTALEICAQVADALAAAHASGVVHRDIKPGNVMLTAAGATILDFGIAAFVDEPAGAVDLAVPVREDRIWATAAYVAPERLTRHRALPASDVYALGVVLYRALAGRRPWPAVCRAEILAAHVWAEPAALPADAGVPPEVVALCHRCLAKDPLARPTAREVATALAAAAAGPARPTGPADGVAGTALAGRSAGPAGVVAGTALVGGGAVVSRRRFQRRHAATASGRRIRHLPVVLAASAGLVAATATLASFGATGGPGRQVAPDAAPLRSRPGTSQPAERPPAASPPSTGPTAPTKPSGTDSGSRGTSGRAGGQPGPGSAPADSGSGKKRTGGGHDGGASGDGPTPGPRPTSEPPQSRAPQPTPSPSSRDPLGGTLSEIEQTLSTLVCALVGGCGGPTASPAS